MRVCSAPHKALLMRDLGQCRGGPVIKLESLGSNTQ